MTPQSLRVAWGEALVELGQKNAKVLVLDGDLANSTRADLFAAAFPGRFLQMGIAEQNMIGVAAGLATLGFIPFISTFAVFSVSRVLDQVRVSVAQPHLNVKITGHYSGIATGKTGKTHQEVEDIAVMRALPNMVVLAPADAVEMRQAMLAAAAHDGPVYLRATRDPSPILFDESRRDYQFHIGRGVVLRQGTDVALIGTGLQTVRCLEAAERLAGEGISAHVLHLPCLKPLDEEAIMAAADRTGLVVTAEEHNIIGGLGSAVAEVLSERRPTPVRRVGLRDVFPESGSNDALLEKYGLTADHVAQAARSLLAKQPA